MWIFWFNSQQLKAHPLILNYRREYWSQEIYSGHTVVASEDPFLLTATVYRHTYLVLLCFSDVTFFYKLKARPFTSKKIVTCFIVILILLQWSASDPVIPLRYARIAWHWPLGSYNLVVPIFKKKNDWHKKLNIVLCAICIIVQTAHTMVFPKNKFLSSCEWINYFIDEVRFWLALKENNRTWGGRNGMEKK